LIFQILQPAFGRPQACCRFAAASLRRGRALRVRQAKQSLAISVMIINWPVNTSDGKHGWWWFTYLSSINFCKIIRHIARVVIL
jgi:hypothetical protein